MDKRPPETEKLPELCECENYTCYNWGDNEMLTVSKATERVVQCVKSIVKNCIASIKFTKNDQ